MVDLIVLGAIFGSEIAFAGETIFDRVVFLATDGAVCPFLKAALRRWSREDTRRTEPLICVRWLDWGRERPLWTERTVLVLPVVLALLRVVDRDVRVVDRVDRPRVVLALVEVVLVVLRVRPTIRLPAEGFRVEVVDAPLLTPTRLIWALRLRIRETTLFRGLFRADFVGFRADCLGFRADFVGFRADFVALVRGSERVVLVRTERVCVCGRRDWERLEMVFVLLFEAERTLLDTILVRAGTRVPDVVRATDRAGLAVFTLFRMVFLRARAAVAFARDGVDRARFTL